MWIITYINEGVKRIMQIKSFAMRFNSYYDAAMSKTKDKFLAKIETYLRRSGISATEFGKRAARSDHFVHQLRKGAYSPRLATYDAVLDWIAENPAKK
jgi:truncated hemoglobin YjbI